MAAVSFYGTGKRKTSIARVWLKPGAGAFTVNNKTLDEYFGRETSKMVSRQSLELTENIGKFDIFSCHKDILKRSGPERTAFWYRCIMPEPNGTREYWLTIVS